MRLINKLARLSLVVYGLILFTGCGERPQIPYYLIHPSQGQAKMTEAEEDKVRAVLDQLAATFQMPKTKPSDAGIIRYYQPTPSLTIAFYAKRVEGKIAVHLMPLVRGFEKREHYQKFHQALVAALSQNFPGRIGTMKEP